MKNLSIRMPDVHDYWDSDWDKIEQKSTGYRIKDLVKPQLRDCQSMTGLKYMFFDKSQDKSEDFLTYHLDADLVTHSKRGQEGVKNQLLVEFSQV